MRVAESDTNRKERQREKEDKTERDERTAEATHGIT
jgi:hypothetical protein